MEAKGNKFVKALEKIKNDNIHGSTYLILKLLDVLEQEIINNDRKNEKLTIIKTLTVLNKSHAEMVEFNNILNKLKISPTLEQVRALKNAYLLAKDKVAKILAIHLNQTNVRSVLTISHSSLVEHGLIYWGNNVEDKKEVKIHVLESRPLREGLILLKRVKESIKNAKFYYWVDAAMGLALNHVDCVLLGMDRMYPDGCIVNKIGSLPLAVLAREKNIPVLAIGTSFKKDKNACPHNPEKYHAATRLSSEVLEEEVIQTIGVTVMNFYFELIPSRYMSKVITEEDGP